MAYLKCNQCGKFTTISTAKYKSIGLGISAFGVFGWFSYMFAGTGSALLIASLIVVGGIGVYLSAQELGKGSLLKERCESVK